MKTTTRWIFLNIVLNYPIFSFYSDNSLWLQYDQRQGQWQAEPESATLGWQARVGPWFWYSNQFYQRHGQKWQGWQLLAYRFYRQFSLGSGVYYHGAGVSPLGGLFYQGRYLHLGWAGGPGNSLGRAAFLLGYVLPCEFFIEQKKSKLETRTELGLQFYYRYVGLRLARSRYSYSTALQFFFTRGLTVSAGASWQYNRVTTYHLSLRYRFGRKITSTSRPRGRVRLKPVKALKPAVKKRGKVAPSFQTMIKWGVSPAQALRIARSKDTCAGNGRARRILKKNNWNCYPARRSK